MSTPKNILDSVNHHVHKNSLASTQQSAQRLADHAGDAIARDFIRFYDARAMFFADAFIKKLKEGNRKALGELQRHALPPTQMDLRQEFAKCLKANLSDEYAFPMKDGKQYTMNELKRLVPGWALIAEQALMKSDPALADKLMSPVQWNAKIAFEVTFVSAVNELKDIKKSKEAPSSLDHYNKWIINPLQKAIEHIKAVNPPGNSLIGYGDRISLSEAMATAENLQAEFEKVLAEIR